MGHSFCPIWDATEKRLKPPEMAPVQNIDEKRRLLERLDTKALHSPIAEKLTRFRSTAFDLLGGGGEFFQALRLSESDRARYGGTVQGDLILTAKQFIEHGAGACTVYDEINPVAYDLHSNIADGMKKIAVPMDFALGKLIEEFSQRCMILISTEFSRTFRINSSGGRDHQQYGSCAILCGPGVVKGIVIGKTDKFGKGIDGDIPQKSTLPNTALIACGLEIPPSEPRIREVLK